MAEGAGVPSLAALEGTPLGWHAAGTLTGLSPGHGSQLLLTASGQGVEAVDGNTRVTHPHPQRR